MGCDLDVESRNKGVARDTLVAEFTAIVDV